MGTLIIYLGKNEGKCHAVSTSKRGLVGTTTSHAGFGCEGGLRRTFLSPASLPWAMICLPFNLSNKTLCQVTLKQQQILKYMLNTETISFFGLFLNCLMFISLFQCSSSKSFIITSGKVRGISFVLNGRNKLRGCVRWECVKLDFPQNKGCILLIDEGSEDLTWNLSYQLKLQMTFVILSEFLF